MAELPVHIYAHFSIGVTSRVFTHISPKRFPHSVCIFNQRFTLRPLILHFLIQSLLTRSPCRIQNSLDLILRSVTHYTPFSALACLPPLCDYVTNMTLSWICLTIQHHFFLRTLLFHSCLQGFVSPRYLSSNLATRYQCNDEIELKKRICPTPPNIDHLYYTHYKKSNTILIYICLFYLFPHWLQKITHWAHIQGKMFLEILVIYHKKCKNYAYIQGLFRK